LCSKPRHVKAIATAALFQLLGLLTSFLSRLRSSGSDVCSRTARSSGHHLQAGQHVRMQSHCAQLRATCTHAAQVPLPKATSAILSVARSALQPVSAHTSNPPQITILACCMLSIWHRVRPHTWPAQPSSWTSH
jgi:hypothetical protein